MDNLKSFIKEALKLIAIVILLLVVRSCSIEQKSKQYQTAYEEGHQEGYNEGYRDGEEEGKWAGYYRGYENGYDDGKRNRWYNDDPPY